MLLTMGQATAGKVYKWTDENGQIHYGSIPPEHGNAKNTGLNTGQASSQQAASNGGSNSSWSGSNNGNQSSSDSRAEQAKAGDEFSKSMQEAELQNALCASQNKTKQGLIKFGAWQQEVIKKCKANHGVDCSDPHYVQSKRPLNAAELEDLNRARVERRNRINIEYANRH
jgi:hypothetical protein